MVCSDRRAVRSLMRRRTLLLFVLIPGYYCFDVLYAHLQTKALAAAAASSGAPAPPAQQPPPPPFDTALECPLFVTFNKRAHPGVPWDLRGCIGNLSPLKLAKLKEYTISSSQRDRRFAPIARRTKTRNTRTRVKYFCFGR